MRAAAGDETGRATVYPLRALPAIPISMAAMYDGASKEAGASATIGVVLPMRRCGRTRAWQGP
ncbi:hypothetical protein BMD20_05195 [Burkholderia multivorans]|jgi:hypothetical protein|nr:hypothetical protein BMD20_05195 [Burkholderia multivorans]KHS20084.1 hypothetical protein BMD22_05425 [Burkholderia multivorans]KVP25194.1 hypothetical protein WJ86_12510 [Burkholderia multivorans]